MVGPRRDDDDGGPRGGPGAQAVAVRMAGPRRDDDDGWPGGGPGSQALAVGRAGVQHTLAIFDAAKCGGQLPKLPSILKRKLISRVDCRIPPPPKRAIISCPPLPADIPLPGQRGPRGFTGAIGPQGRPGRVGPQGRRGRPGSQVKGVQGKRGTQGSQGKRGVQGKRGAQGPQGKRGPQSRGHQGSQGPQGRRGPQGYRGVQGHRGVQGYRGAQGRGHQGYRGPQGYRGVQGKRGPQGGPGHRGPHGQQGARGPQGPPGGKHGQQGPPGPRGPKGQGHQGPRGPRGWRGQRGPRGPKGDRGPQGGCQCGPQMAQFVRRARRSWQLDIANRMTEIAPIERGTFAQPATDAHVTVAHIADDYHVRLHSLQSPDIRYQDVVTIINYETRPEIHKAVDGRFLAICDEDSIVIQAIVCDEPCMVGGDVVNNHVVIKMTPMYQMALPTKIVVTLSGKKRNRPESRFVQVAVPIK